MSIKIPVTADFDPSKIEAQLQQFTQQLNSLGAQMAKVNKLKFEPISKATIEDMRKVNKEFDALKKVSGDLNRRLNITGQGSASFAEVDWKKLYPNDRSRNAHMTRAFEYVTGGGNFSAPPGGGGFAKAAGSVAGNAAQAGLRAMNPVTGGAGGVAANALGTGMSAGVGAGLAGLLGGIVALGIGKAVGAVTEKIETAENNSWATDQLKRTIGDVNVSFSALKASVESASRNIDVTYSEGLKLASEFSKLSNVTADQYKTIGSELETGGGMSRAFGLDPSQGVGVLGQMRGMNLTRDEQGSRKMALLIGETIAKSNAFAKAGEVMDAVAGYATSQARSSLSANVGGFAGALAGLANSGQVGLDVNNSAAILNRVNASLTAGGAHGEASQFFSAAVGARRGLNPYQLQLWREGGAFATLDSTFKDKDSMAKKFGMDGPGGNETWMQATIGDLQKRYGNNKGMLANATANHLGVSMTQAMALLQYKPQELGGMQKMLGSGFDLKNLNASAISTLGKIMTGDSSTLQSVAGQLRSRKDLTGDERSQLDNAMSSGNVETQKEVLSRLVASREQEETDGKNIHDSKVALENLKTDMAGKLIPLTQGIRDGILHLAGGRTKSRVGVMQEMEELNSGEAVRRLKEDAEGKAKQIKDEAEEARMKVLTDPNATGRIKNEDWWKEAQEKIKNGTITPSELKEFRARVKAYTNDYTTRSVSDTAADELSAIDEEKKRRLEANEKARDKAIADENTRKEKALKTIDETDRTLSGQKVTDEPNMSGDSDLRKRVADAEKRIGAPDGLLWAQLEQESHFNPNARSKAGAMGIAQIMPDTVKALRDRFGRKLNPYDPSDAVDMQAEVMRENYAHFGNWDDALRAYNGGWKPWRWGNKETANYAPSIRRRQNRWGGTPLPEDGSSGSVPQRFILDAPPIEVLHKNERGEQVMPPQMLATSIRPASPFGTERFS